VLVRILIVAAVALFLFAWVRAVIDVVRRRDIGVGAKVLWAIGMLVLPLIGLLVYTLVRPPSADAR
jgi:hypothetical protein